MKTILDKETRDQLIGRVDSLDENSTPLWGTMNIYQMLKHCTIAEEMYLGKKQYKRMFLGRLLGKIMLNKMLKDDSPMERNAPTSTHFKVSENSGDVEAQKRNGYCCFGNMSIFQTPALCIGFSGQ
jgi:hypothetical protein